MARRSSNRTTGGSIMAKETRFQVRDTQEELEKLDKAIKALGYKDRADWYRDCKRQVIRQVEGSIKVEGEGK